jgi:hypothetical protein
MWYRLARQTMRKIIGGGIRPGTPSNDEVAMTPTSEERMRTLSEQRVRLRRMLNPKTHRTLEERLEETPNRNGFMSTPAALNLMQGVLPAGILDHHPTTHPSGDATAGGTFTEEFRYQP